MMTEQRTKKKVKIKMDNKKIKVKKKKKKYRQVHGDLSLKEIYDNTPMFNADARLM